MKSSYINKKDFKSKQGYLLRKARIEKGLLQKELAELLGVSRATITEYESRRKCIPLNQWEKIINYA